MIFVIVSVIVGLVALVGGYVCWCFWILDDGDECSTCGAVGGKRYATIAPSDALVCECCAHDELRAMHVNENILCAAPTYKTACTVTTYGDCTAGHGGSGMVVGAYKTQEGFKQTDDCKCNAYDGLGPIHLPTCHLAAHKSKQWATPAMIHCQDGSCWCWKDTLHWRRTMLQGYDVDNIVELTEEQLQEIRSNLDKPFSTPITTPIQSNGDNAFGGIEEFGAIDDESWMTAGEVVDSDLGLITYPTKTHRYHIAGVAVTKEAFQWAGWVFGRNIAQPEQDGHFMVASHAVAQANVTNVDMHIHKVIK